MWNMCVRFMSGCTGLLLYRSKSMNKMKIDSVIIYLVVEEAWHFSSGQVSLTFYTPS